MLLNARGLEPNSRPRALDRVFHEGARSVNDQLENAKERHWTLWAGILVLLGCLATIAATLNDI